MKNRYKVLAIILAIFIIFALSGNIDTETSKIFFGQSNSFVWVIVMLVAYIAIIKSFEIKDKRLQITAIILAILLSIMQVLGEILDTYLDLNLVLTKLSFMTFYMAKWIGFATIIYVTIIRNFFLFE